MGGGREARRWQQRPQVALQRVLRGHSPLRPMQSWQALEVEEASKGPRKGLSTLCSAMADHKLRTTLLINIASILEK